MLYLLTQEIHFLGIYPKEIYKDLDKNLCKMVLFTRFILGQGGRNENHLSKTKHHAHNKSILKKQEIPAPGRKRKVHTLFSCWVKNTSSTLTWNKESMIFLKG